MTDETTTEQLAEIEGQGDTVQVREGRWRTRGGEIVNVTPSLEDDPRRDRFPWQDAGEGYTWRNDGRWVKHEESVFDLREYLGPIEPDKTQELPDKTQELETKTQELPEYTPPEGWRVVRFGELLQPGDMWVNQDGTERRSAILHWDAAAVSGGRCIRRIEPQPEPQPEVEPQAAKIEELRSEVSYVQRLLGTERRRVTQLEELVGSLRNINDAQEKAFGAAGKENTALQTQLEAVKAESAKRLQQVEELRSEVSYVQGLLGEEKRRFAELETLTSDLRAVNAAQQKGINSAAREKADLQHRLDVVAAEWALQAETIRGLESLLEAVKAELVQVSKDRQALQIELDAAQQVPADSPELRQLRAELERMTLGRDMYQDGYSRVLSDLETIRETTKAETVETIAEWLQPIRAVDSEHLANETLQHLPQIMRHLTGLDSHAID